ncbi:hypothetical protein VFPFJ_11414 [Purpureocillium lilacinum]|uniref:Uncharacterized protein n=1 Tax=Purpureocillium lilacinum TaxID=33203 RepID=A0A179FB77_PURLI|nr:hypothetical protein VFPFJ_11414 [Purpureocillium lilacinum]OAQ62560.1 hypothetical protein VFPFJ_11414 [Purpureocillium lilacinum]
MVGTVGVAQRASCTTSALRIFVRGSQRYNPRVKVECLHALCFDFVEVKAQTLVAYIGAPASITGALHHKANLSFVYKTAGALSYAYR